MSSRSYKVRNGIYTLNNIFAFSEVPQGNKLGLLLFLMYISYLSNVIQYSTLLIYADDCKLPMQIK